MRATVLYEYMYSLRAKIEYKMSLSSYSEVRLIISWAFAITPKQLLDHCKAS